MAAKGGHIDFMFLGPPPHPAAGSDAVIMLVSLITFHLQNYCVGLKKHVTYLISLLTDPSFVRDLFITCCKYVFREDFVDISRRTSLDAISRWLTYM